MLLHIITAAALLTGAPQNGTWTNVTGTLGGPKWGYSGVNIIKTVPGTNRILAGVSGAGMWKSDDQGTSWQQLEGGAVIGHRTTDIVFDPKNADTFWVGGCYGPGVYKTTDGGRSFVKLGNVDHVDGLAVDLFDEYRRTLVVGIHEKTREMMVSFSSGISWKPIGDNLPAGAGQYGILEILAEDTLVVAWPEGRAPGIFRSTDTGKTWTKTAEYKATGRGVFTKDKVYLLPVAGGTVRSNNAGRTWDFAPGPGLRQLEVQPDGSILGLAENRLHISRDGGATWQPFGPVMPIKPSGFTFIHSKQTLIIWQNSATRATNAVYRWR
jgi:hypothetical protein